MNKAACALVILLCLVTVSCEKKEPLSDYEIQCIREPLSLVEIETSLDLLGLDVKRFDYYLPVRSKMNLFSQEYISGMAQDIKRQSSLYVDKGKQRLIIFAKRDENSVSFSAQSRGGRVSCGQFDFTGLDSTTQGDLRVEKIAKGSQVPLYLFAANEGGITGFSANDNIDDIIEKYQIVFVLYASIE